MSKTRIFQFTWFYQETNDKNQIKWDPEMIKITSGTVLKTSEHEEFIEQQYFSLKIKDLIKMFWKSASFFLSFWLKYCWYPYFWHLNQGEFLGYYSDFWSKFLLGTKIAHVWEENELLIISIWGDSDPIIGCYKITQSMVDAVS